MKSVKSIISLAVFGLFLSSAIYCAQNYFEVNVTNKTGGPVTARSEIEAMEGIKAKTIANNGEASFKLWEDKVLQAQFGTKGQNVYIQAKSKPTKTPYIVIKKNGKVDAKNFKVSTWIR